MKSLVAAAVVALVVATCAGASTPAPRATPATTPTPSAPATSTATVTLRDDGCEYLGPSVVGAGTVVLELVNRSIGQFDAHLWLPSVGHTYDELAAHIAEEQRRLEAGEPGLGHPAFATLVAEASVSGAQGTLSKDLSPGTYGLACIRFEGGSRVAIRAVGPFTVGE